VASTRERIREVREEALAALVPLFARRAPPLAYRASLALVSLVVALLPLVYVALVAALGWGVWWYAEQGDRFFGSHISLAYFVVRFGPIVAGAVLFFFLFKPLLARPAQRRVPHVLRPEEQPFLFDFVRAIATALGAPMPEHIVVDLRVNASASFAHGWRSLFDGSLALTVGLPLVSGLRLRELAAVLAHEFGHLSQGAGMRFYYTTASVNHWFARVVFERDHWDQRLQAWSRFDWLVSMLVLKIAVGGVWVSRRLLLLLLKVAAAASSHMSRQMEFDADRNASALCGADSFVRSMELLPQIEAAQVWASTTASAAFREGRLPDDLPFLVAHGMGLITPEGRAQIVAAAAGGTVSMYATHPPTNQRVARARAAGDAGVFTIDAPASILFRDYPELCRTLTRDLYDATVKAFDQESLAPSAILVAADDELRANAARVNEYFLGANLGPGTFALSSLSPGCPEKPSETIEALKRAREDAQKARASQATAPQEDNQLARLIAVRELRAAQLKVIDPEHKNLTHDEAAKAVDAERDAREVQRAELAPFAAGMRARVAAALDLLHVPSVAERVEGAEDLRERGTRAARFLIDLTPLAGNAHELRHELGAIDALIPQVQGQDPVLVGRMLARRAFTICGLLAALRERAGQLPYPFQRGKALRLADYLVPTLPKEGLWSEAGGAAQVTLEVYDRLLVTAFGELATVGLAVERAVQLPPLTVEPPRIATP
jgi:Zn-dependent protease with chaperone function